MFKKFWLTTKSILWAIGLIATIIAALIIIFLTIPVAIFAILILVIYYVIKSSIEEN